ncbi:MAG: hypothetical protein ACLQF0_01145 [Dissulfurispiraceae bacterium]
MSSNPLVIFSDPAHARTIASSYRPEEALYMAFSVQAKMELERMGYPCLFPDDLVELPDFNLMGHENEERVRKICSSLDEILRERIPFLGQNSINIISAVFYYVKVFFDGALSSYYVMKRVLDHLDDRPVVVFKTFAGTSRMVSGRSDIALTLIEQVFAPEYKNIAVITSGKSGHLKEAAGRLKELARDVRTLACALAANGQAEKPSCIVLYDSYDVRDIIDVMDGINFHTFHTLDFKAFRVFIAPQNKGKVRLRILHSDGYEYKAAVGEAFRKAAESQSYRLLLGDNDKLCSFVNMCLESFFVEKLGEYLMLGDYIKETIRELGPKMVLSSSCRLTFEWAFVLEIARSLCIPVVAYQEGGGAGYEDWPVVGTDTRLADYFLVYGNGVKESPFIEKNCAQVVPIGSLHLERTKSRLKHLTPPKASIYVIVDNISTGIHQHYPYNGGFFCQAFRRQRMILDILKQFKDMSFVIKTIRGREWLYAGYADGKRVRVDTRPLSSILDEASAFVLQRTSTVLLECLLTDRPIALLYDGEDVKFAPDAHELLSRRVRMSSNPGEFPETIRALTNDIKYGSSMTEHTEFRDAYCLVENTADRLKNFFDGLISKGSVFPGPAYG